MIWIGIYKVAISKIVFIFIDEELFAHRRRASQPVWQLRGKQAKRNRKAPYIQKAVLIINIVKLSDFCKLPL